MRYLLPFGLLLLSLNLSAQVAPDSLRQSTKVGQQVSARKDSLDVRIRCAQRQLDSLRRLPRSWVDSSRVGRYGQQQRDSLQQRLNRWQARRDSLLRPLDTLNQKRDALRQRGQSLRDSLDQKLPVGQATEALRSVAAERLSDEPPLPTSAIPAAVPKLSVPKVASQLPDLPPPVHAIRKQAGAWQEKLQSYSGKLSGYQGKAAAFTSPGSEAAEQQALRHLPEGQALQQNHGALQDRSGQQAVSEEQQRAELQQRLLASARDHFAQHQPELQQAQQKLADMKKKYTLVQGEQQRKRSSLQGTPLSERLIYGGTMQLNRVPSLAVDLSPQLAYRWNQRLSTGLGASYRLILSEDYWAAIRKSITTDNAVYGGRAFAEYEVIRSFLLHGEYERMSQPSPAVNRDAAQRTWQTSLLAGIGKTYRIAGKWRGSVLLLYNFRHEHQSGHARPWVFRFGFQRSGE